MVDREKLRLAGWAAAALVAVLLGVRLIGAGGGGGEAAGVTVDPAGASSQRGAAAPRGSGSSELLVQVAGEVARPGVYRVPAGSRVTDAVTRAGGLTSKADQAGVNLVARVQDGQQVIVPRRGAGGASGAVAGAGAGGAGGASGGGPATPISLSSATVAQLDTLDGIGPTLAQRIVDYRQAHGGFSSVDQLRQVSGIGEKRFAALRKAVTP
jgi:competence protein ComEA